MEEEQDQVLSIYRRLLEAWNRRDPDAFASLFAANAVQSLVVVIDAGRRRIALLHNTPAAFHGRPHLGEQLTEELAEVVRHGDVVAAAG
jgi:uncharacterized protein (TIGR02246 family)